MEIESILLIYFSFFYVSFTEIGFFRNVNCMSELHCVTLSFLVLLRSLKMNDPTCNIMHLMECAYQESIERCVICM